MTLLLVVQILSLTNQWYNLKQHTKYYYKMAAPYNPPTKNEDFAVQIALEDYANPGNFKANPTLAAGDFKISKDGGAFANLNTLPTVTPASGVAVYIILSSTEMNADYIIVTCIDQTAPKEWADYSFSIPTTA
jgi:hypothetical protein